jgi:predicted transcriptional regulator
MPSIVNRTIIELSDDLTSHVEELAAKTGRSKAELVNDAVHQYLANQQRWRHDLDAALLDTEKGSGYDGDEVLAWIDSWGTDNEKPRPRLTTVKP